MNSLDKICGTRYSHFYMASYPSGKGMVCKTTMKQFDSVRRLKMDCFSAVHFF